MEEKYIKPLIQLLLSVIGFFLIFEFSKMNSNITEIQKEVTEIKLSIVAMQENMLTEEKVRNICVEEIHKHILNNK